MDDPARGGEGGRRAPAAGMAAARARLDFPPPILPPVHRSIAAWSGKRHPVAMESHGRRRGMSDQRRASGAPVETYSDRTPQSFGDVLPDPLVYDASPRMLRQRTMNFAAKRLVDMRYVSGLDRVTAERHFRWRPAVPPGGLGFRPAPDGEAGLGPPQRPCGI